MAESTYETQRTDVRTGAVGGAERYDANNLPGDPGPSGGGGSADAGERSIGTLLKELRDESATLMRQEFALAKTEMSEKASKAGKNAASIAVGGAVAYAGVLVLLFGIAFLLYFILHAIGLSNSWAGVLAFLIVGGVTAGIGYAMINKGLTALKQESMVPQKTIESLKEDKQWLTNQTSK